MAKIGIDPTGLTEEQMIRKYAEKSEKLLQNNLDGFIEARFDDSIVYENPITGERYEIISPTEKKNRTEKAQQLFNSYYGAEEAI